MGVSETSFKGLFKLNYTNLVQQPAEASPLKVSRQIREWRHNSRCHLSSTDKAPAKSGWHDPEQKWRENRIRRRQRKKIYRRMTS